MLRRNVLIFHSGAMGDFILTWPLALALGRLFPQSRIFYVTHRQKGLLAERVLRVGHPGGGSRHKNWPAGHFLRLAERLAADGLRPRILLGDVEQDLWKPAEVAAFAAAGDLRRPQDLIGLLQDLDHAGVFVGND